MITELDYFLIRTCWIHAWIRKAMEAWGWSYAELSRRTGIKAQTLSKWLKDGCRPQRATYDKLTAVAPRPYIEHESCKHCQPGSLEYKRSTTWVRRATSPQDASWMGPGR